MGLATIDPVVDPNGLGFGNMGPTMIAGKHLRVASGPGLTITARAKSPHFTKNQPRGDRQDDQKDEIADH